MMRRLPWCPRPPASDEKRNVAAMFAAFDLYARHAHAALPGWPTDPVLALLRMASTPLPPYQRYERQPDGSWRSRTDAPGLPDTIGYAIAGLRMLARDMAAADTLLQARRPHISRPELYRPPAPNRLGQERPDVWDEPDKLTRRDRIRDQLVAAGGTRASTTPSTPWSSSSSTANATACSPSSSPTPAPPRCAPTPPLDARLAPADPRAGLTSRRLGNDHRRRAPLARPDTIELWLTPMTPLGHADGTLTIGAQTRHLSFVRTRSAGCSRRSAKPPAPHATCSSSTSPTQPAAAPTHRPRRSPTPAPTAKPRGPNATCAATSKNAAGSSHSASTRSPTPSWSRVATPIPPQSPLGRAARCRRRTPRVRQPNRRDPVLAAATPPFRRRRNPYAYRRRAPR